MDVAIEQKNEGAANGTGLVARNTAYLTGALVVQKVISFFYFTFIARFTGHAVTGDYASALAFAGLFAFIADFGLVPVVIREVARDKQHAEKYLHNTLALRVGLCVFAFAALLIGYAAADAYVGWLGIEHLNRPLVLIAGAVMIMDSFTVALYGVFRGFQKLQYEALGSVLNKVIVAAIGVVGVLSGLSVTFLLTAILCGSIFNVLYACFFLVKKLGIRPRLRLDRAIAVHLLRLSLPFAVAALFANVYANFDSVYLRLHAGKGATGWYAVAYKLTFALQFVPAAFAASLFPAMSEYFISSREKLANIFEKAMYYLMLVSLPMSVGLFILADRIIVLMYRDAFVASIEPFRILMGALVAVFLNYPVGYLLNACNKQGVNTVNMGVATLINVLLNIVLIPRYTFNGAAIATLVSSWVLLGMGLFWVRTVTDYRKSFLWKSFSKVALATTAMAGVLWVSSGYIADAFVWVAAQTLPSGSKFISLVQDGGYLVALTMLGAFVYALALVLVRGVSLDEWQFVTAAFTRRLRKQ